MKVEYLILFKKDGTPVYSKCYGGFCAKLNYDETLLSGFLSALTSMPEVFGASEEDIQSMEMGFIKFHFNYVPSKDIFAVLGVNTDTITIQFVRYSRRSKCCSVPNMMKLNGQMLRTANL